MRKITKKWTTKYGQRVRICDMTDSHLLNAMRLLHRVAWQSYSRDTKLAELFVATRYPDETVHYGPHDYLPPIYRDMWNDAIRRDLDLGGLPKPAIEVGLESVDEVRESAMAAMCLYPDMMDSDILLDACDIPKDDYLK